MATAYKWVEMLLQNSKVVGGALIVLLTALGFTGFTAVEQHKELTELRTVPVEILVEVPAVAKPVVYDHSLILKDIKTLKAEAKQLESTVNELRKWH